MPADEREKEEGEAPAGRSRGAGRSLFGPPTQVPHEHEEGSRDAEKISRLKKEDLLGAGKAAGRARYAKSQEIGRGAMGAILKVFDNDLRRNLAMKVILAQEDPDASDLSATPDLVERFLAEAQITGQLEHPGIVPVHELGVDEDGRAYFTMRLVRGKDFSEVIELARERKEGWNMPRALGTLLKICETVSYAHARGVVHRDLKPANIMIGRFGETYVMDWGTARLAEDEKGKTLGSSTVVQTDRQELAAMEGGSASTTQEGAVLGTPFYMPYEQAAGLLDEIGPHTDVYAVGSMLYELLTGLRPYEQDRGARQSVYSVLSAIYEGPPAPPHLRSGKAPPELLAICEKAMAYDWHDRYPNMLAMAEDLRAFLEGRVVQAYDTGTFTRLRKWVSRNRPLAAALCGLVVLLLGGIAGTMVLQNQKLTAVRAQQALTNQAMEFALENADRARRESYVAGVSAASACLRSNETREAKRLLENAPEDLRGWEWSHLNLRADSSDLTVSAPAGPIRSLAVAPGGTRFLASSDDGSVRVWDARSGALDLVLEEDVDDVVAAGFAPDGRRLVTFEGWTAAQLRSWDTSSGELLSAMNLEATPTSITAMSVDGALLAFATLAHELHLVDAQLGRSLFVLEGHDRAVSALAFDAAGGRLFSASEDGTVRAWSTTTGELLETLDGPDGPLLALAVHPTRQELVTGAEGGVVRSWNMDGTSSRPLARHSSAVLALAYGPEGDRLASATFERRLEVLELSSGRTRILRGHDEPARRLAFLDASRLVAASEDGSLRVWDLDGRDPVDVYRDEDDFANSLAVSPDSASIAVGSAFGGTLRLLLRGTGALIGEVVGQEDSINAVAFGPTGTPSAGRIAAGYEGDASVRLYDASDLALERVLHEPSMLSVTALAFRSDGEVLATGSEDYSIRLWAPSSGLVLQGLEVGASVLALAFEASGTRLAAALEDGSVLVLDSATGERVAILEGLVGGATSLAWSFDGRRLAVGAGDSVLRLWDLQAEPLLLRGHEQRITCLSFHPHGNRLISGSFDHSLRVWDVDAGRLLLTLREHEQPVTAVAFAPDGDTVVSASFDQTIRVWNTR